MAGTSKACVKDKPKVPNQYLGNRLQDYRFNNTQERTIHKKGQYSYHTFELNLGFNNTLIIHLNLIFT